MRIRTGLRPEDWLEVGPAYAGSIPIRGELVQSPSRPAKGAGLTPTQKAPRVPQPIRPPGRPRLSDNVVMRGRGRKYATDEERLAARRQAWRDSKARSRAA